MPKQTLASVFTAWALVVNACLYLQLWQKFQGYVVERLRLLWMILR